jgi:hypothetical protein
MSSEIMLRDASAPADPNANLLVRFENTINAPILSVVPLYNGQAVAGVYTVVALDGSSVTVTAEDPKNELVGASKTVIADGATVNKNTIGGLGIVFSGGLAAGWTAVVAVGALQAVGGATSPRLNIGIVLADSLSTQRRLTAVNIGTESSAETSIVPLPGFIAVGSNVHTTIVKLTNHSDIAREELAVPDDLVVTFQDYQPGAVDTADVYVDGVKAIEDAKLDGSTLYQYGKVGYIDGVDKFKGLGIVFASGMGDPTSRTFTIHIREGYEWIEFAPDVAGSPGTWVAGSLTLTESGQPTGVITAAGAVNFWFRSNVPLSAAPGDMKMSNLRVRGLTV